MPARRFSNFCGSVGTAPAKAAVAAMSATIRTIVIRRKAAAPSAPLSGRNKLSAWN
jgi:hypothetical protein